MYYKNGLTELLPLALEFNAYTLDDLNDKVNWQDDNKSEYYPDWMAAVLAAIQPKKVRNAGGRFPTLLSDPPVHI